MSIFKLVSVLKYTHPLNDEVEQLRNELAELNRENQKVRNELYQLRGIKEGLIAENKKLRDRIKYGDCYAKKSD